MMKEVRKEVCHTGVGGVFRLDRFGLWAYESVSNWSIYCNYCNRTYFNKCEKQYLIIKLFVLKKASVNI